MHEYGVAQSIINIVSGEASKLDKRRVTSVTLVIGDMASIVDDSLVQFFELLSKGTPCEGAELTFKRVQVELHCPSCNKNFTKPKTGFECPDCNETGKLTDIGKEFYIDSIEVE